MLINNTVDFKPQSHICDSTKASYGLTCLLVFVFHPEAGVSDSCLLGIECH